jgi:hypothetical protein
VFHVFQLKTKGNLAFRSFVGLAVPKMVTDIDVEILDLLQQPSADCLEILHRVEIADVVQGGGRPIVPLRTL